MAVPHRIRMMYCLILAAVLSLAMPPAQAAPDVKTACLKKPGTYLVQHTYSKAGKVVRAGTCQACVSRLSAYSNTVVPGNTVCYKSVTDSAGTGCVKAKAKATPLTTFGRPQACMPAGAEGQKLLLAPTAQLGLALFKRIDTGSLRLAGLRLRPELMTFAQHDCVAQAGLELVGISDNTRTLELDFDDPRNLLTRHRGATVQLTGWTTDPATRLKVCFTAGVRVC